MQKLGAHNCLGHIPMCKSFINEWKLCAIFYSPEKKNTTTQKLLRFYRKKKDKLGMFGRLGRGMRSARGRRWRGRGKVAQQGGFVPQWAWRDSKIHSKRPHACTHPMLSLSAVVNKWEHVSWEKIWQLDHKEGWECGGGRESLVSNKGKLARSV